MHDGAGIRTVVFFAGCPLHCAWCHNPETQSVKPEVMFCRSKCINCGACSAVCPTGSHRIADDIHTFDRSSCVSCMDCVKVCCSKALSPTFTEMSAVKIVGEVEKDRAFYGDSGGITLSGGEPLLQANGALEVLKKCRESGIGTAVETCGYFDPAILPELVPLVDCFLWDLKDGNDGRHIKYTGVSNRRIINNLLLADSLGAQTVLRCIMVKGVNMCPEHYAFLSDIRHKLKNCRGIDLLPYHACGSSKMTAIGKPDNSHPDWVPSETDLSQAETFFAGHGITTGRG